MSIEEVIKNETVGNISSSTSAEDRRQRYNKRLIWCYEHSRVPIALGLIEENGGPMDYVIEFIDNSGD